MTSDQRPAALCPMCERVGYPVSDCPTCNAAVYCATGRHTFDDDESPCRYCPAHNDSSGQVPS